MSHRPHGKAAPGRNRVEAIAEWAASLAFDDIPASVLDLARAQRRSVLGAIAASADVESAGRVLATVRTWGGEGPAPLLGGHGRKVTVEDALFAGAALSIALDFDDYLLFGHTGHSAVLTPILLAAETGASGTDQLVAQVAANEVAARLGGTCLLGPQNGQMWSFIHAAGAAIAGGLLLHLDRRRLAHAVAIALYQPPHATVPGFFEPDSKLLTASEPAVAGLRAARLAAAGVTGPLDVLDASEGFLAAFADAPLPGMLGGLGEAWATRTLCVKAYPGCAYVDTAVDALVELGPPMLEDIESVEVAAGLLTVAMDAMSRRYLRKRAPGTVPTPVAINFSVPWSLGVVLCAGELAPAQFGEEWRRTNGARLEQAASKVSVRIDAVSVRRSTEQFAKVLPLRALAKQVGLGGFGRAAARLVRTDAGPAFSEAMTSGLLRTLASPRAGLGVLRQLLPHAPGYLAPARGDRQRSGGAKRWWDPDALASFAMEFPARVVVRTTSGERREATVAVPRGAVGHPVDGPGIVAAEKLARFGPLLFGKEGTEALEEAIVRDDPRLHALLGPSN